LCETKKEEAESYFFVPVLKPMQEKAEEDGISEDGASDNKFASAFLFSLLQITSLLYLCDATL
jgi:hypothetical protein